MTRDAGNAGRGAAQTEDGLYERDVELAALSQALTAARDGTGGLVVVEGPAGIGKSRLLAEARAIAGELGLVVLTARGIDLEHEASFGVASGLFAASLAAVPGGERERLLSGHASLAAPLFHPAAPLTENPSALVRGLYWLAVNVASEARCSPPRPTGSGRWPRWAGCASTEASMRRLPPPWTRPWPCWNPGIPP